MVVCGKESSIGLNTLNVLPGLQPALSRTMIDSLRDSLRRQSARHWDMPIHMYIPPWPCRCVLLPYFTAYTSLTYSIIAGQQRFLYPKPHRKSTPSPQILRRQQLWYECYLCRAYCTAGPPLRQEAIHQFVGSEKHRQRWREGPPGPSWTSASSFLPWATHRHHIRTWSARRLNKDVAEGERPSKLLAAALAASGAWTTQCQYTQLWLRLRLGQYEVQHTKCSRFWTVTFRRDAQFPIPER